MLSAWISAPRPVLCGAMSALYQSIVPARTLHPACARLPLALEDYAVGQVVQTATSALRGLDIARPQERNKIAHKPVSSGTPGLLQREEGASLGQLVEATGSLPHTSRAALTRLRQNGHDLQKEKRDTGETLYRIAAPARVARSRKAA